MTKKDTYRLFEIHSRLAHSTPIFKNLKLLKLRDIAKHQMVLLMHRKLQNNLPHLIDQLFITAQPSKNSRNVKHFKEAFITKLYKTYTISWAAPRIWNKIIVPMFPIVQTVPTSKYTVKQISRCYLTNQY